MTPVNLIHCISNSIVRKIIKSRIKQFVSYCAPFPKVKVNLPYKSLFDTSDITVSYSNEIVNFKCLKLNSVEEHVMTQYDCCIQNHDAPHR